MKLANSYRSIFWRKHKLVVRKDIFEARFENSNNTVDEFEGVSHEKFKEIDYISR